MFFIIMLFWRNLQNIAGETWLQEKIISFGKRALEAKLLNLTLSTHPQVRGETISLILVSLLNRLLLVYR